MKCPYCKIEMNPEGHSSGECNGWYCEKCGHERPEMGSYSIAGRPDVDLTCYCSNCEKKRKKENMTKHEKMKLKWKFLK